MDVLDSLPSLPDWVPYPRLVWFVVEGVLLGLVGLLIRESLGPHVQGLIVAGNVVYVVGGLTAVFGVAAWIVLLVLNR